jgi:hypothetical protein
MPFVPAIHAFPMGRFKDVDVRHKAKHDEIVGTVQNQRKH